MPRFNCSNSALDGSDTDPSGWGGMCMGSLPQCSSILRVVPSMPSPKSVVLTQGEHQPAFSARKTPEGWQRPAGEEPKLVDPYRDVRRHLAAAAIVILSVVALGSFLLLP